MRKFSLLFLIGILAAACVDKDYDLSDVDTDNIAIGDGKSEFRIPLATIRIKNEEIAGAGQQGDIREMFGNADIWLPTALPATPGGQTDCIDLTALDDVSYTNRLFDALFDEMATSQAKLDEITALVLRDYKAEFARALGIPGSFLTADYFQNAFRDSETAGLIRNEARTQALDYLNGLDTIEPLDYDLGSIDLDSDVVDMLADNLDEKNTLHLYGRIVSSLPVTLRLEPQFVNTTVEFEVEVKSDAENEIDEVPIFEQDLRTIVDGTHIAIPIRPEYYYPERSFSNREPVVIELRLVKRGALNLDL